VPLGLSRDLLHSKLAALGEYLREHQELGFIYPSISFTGLLYLSQKIRIRGRNFAEEYYTERQLTGWSGQPETAGADKTLTRIFV